MSSALDKLLRLSGSPVVTAAGPVEADAGSELVLAALSVLEDAQLLLASDDPDNDGDDDDSPTGDTDHDYAGSPLYKKLIAKGMSKEAALKFVKNEKARQAKAKGKKVAAAAAVEAAMVALGGLSVPELRLSWEDRTATGGFIALGGNAPGNGSKPYGNVKYADPGYRADGKKRYPIDTEEHARAAWAYISKSKNASQYSSADLKKVKGAIMRACKKFGIDVSSVAATGEAVAPLFGLADVRGYERLEHGHMEHVSPYEEMRRRFGADTNGMFSQMHTHMMNVHGGYSPKEYEQHIRQCLDDGSLDSGKWDAQVKADAAKDASAHSEWLRRRERVPPTR